MQFGVNFERAIFKTLKNEIQIIKNKVKKIPTSIKVVKYGKSQIFASKFLDKIYRNNPKVRATV
jgi:hypothetical protein